jgi:peptide/nickel transport system permease protein
MSLINESQYPELLSESSPSLLAGTRRRLLLHDRASLVAIGFLAAIVLIAIIGPFVISANPNLVDLSRPFEGPQSGALLGYDGQGRDLLARLVYGGRTALLGPLVVVGLSAVLGSALALTAAWLGGWFDSAVARVIDAMFAFPGILLAILAVTLFGPGLLPAGVGLSIAYTPYLARLVRAAALRERVLPYVDALVVQGVPAPWIVLRHILPNLRNLIVATSTLAYGYALLDLAALSFIGLGVQPPTADWGVMVSDGVPGILQGYPGESLYAGLIIVLTVVAINFLGDRLTARWEARG